MRIKLTALFLVVVCGWVSTAKAQIVDPGELDKIHILGITQWEFQKSLVTETNKEQKYLARIRVQFENTGSYYSVFRKPQFEVALRVPGSNGKVGTVESSQQGNVQNMTMRYNDPNGRVIALGPARLPNKSDVALFHMLAPGHDAIDTMQKTDEFALRPATKDGRAIIEEIDFIIEFGPVSTQTADHLLMDVFNIVTNKERVWKTSIRGETYVGVRSISSGATIYSVTPVAIEMLQKPPVRIAD